MKLSRKLMMVSAAALMGISPVIAPAVSSNVAQAATKKATKKTVTKSGDETKLGSNAYIYDKNGKRNTNYKYDGKVWKMIGKGSTIQTYGTTTIDGTVYFDIGDGNYIKAGNVATVNGKKYTSSTKASTTSKKTTTTKKTDSDKKATSKKDDSKSIELIRNAYVYDKNGKRIKSAGTLKKGSTVEYLSTVTIKNKKYLDLGKGQFIKVGNVNADDIIDDNTPTGTLTHNAYVYDKNGKRIKSAKTLKKGATIKYTGTKTIKGKDYYNLGKGQFVKAANVKPDVDDQQGDDENVKNTYVKLIKNAYIYDENGKRVANTGLLFKGLEYQTVGDGAKKINDVWYYQIGHNQFIKAVNAVVSSGDALIPADEDPAKPNADADATLGTTIATWKENASLYNSKGVVKPNTYFNQGHQARVNKLLYIWVKAENKAELFYQVASAKDSYVKADVVDVKDSTLAISNTQEEAKNLATPATTETKQGLVAAINAAEAVKKEAAYTLASPTAKQNFDKALQAAKDINESVNANMAEVNTNLNALVTAQGQLNGRKVQVTDLNNLSASEQEQIIQVVANAEGVPTSSVKFSGNTNVEVTSATGYVSTKPVTDYATATPQTAASVN